MTCIYLEQLDLLIPYSYVENLVQLDFIPSFNKYLLGVLYFMVQKDIKKALRSKERHIRPEVNSEFTF